MNSASATFTSSENGSTFECKLDGGDFAACQTGKTYKNLSDGSHTFSVRAKNAAGNTDDTPASRTWTVDATTPDTTIISGPTEGARVNATRQTFSFTSSEGDSTFECSVDNGATYESCSSGDTFTFIVGSNTFEVKATDAAGNRDQTPANHAFTVDTTAPGAPSITAPATNSFDQDGSFDIRGTAEPGSTVHLYEGATQVGTDEADPQSGAWTIALVDVPEGSYTYKAKATDAAGNVSQDSQPTTVVVDKTVPTLTAKTPTGTGAARNTNVSATFSERMDEASIEAAGTVTLDPATNLGSKAMYKVEITTAAKDAAGNALAQPETWTFTTAAR